MFPIVENSNWTHHIVENITRCFPHWGNYQRFIYKIFFAFYLWHSTLLIIWNISSTFLQLSLQICGNFHKSFRNLPNFFRKTCSWCSHKIQSLPVTMEIMLKSALIRVVPEAGLSLTIRPQNINKYWGEEIALVLLEDDDLFLYTMVVMCFPYCFII